MTVSAFMSHAAADALVRRTLGNLSAELRAKVRRELTAQEIERWMYVGNHDDEGDMNPWPK
jgi:hypothetical protein